MQSVHLGSGSLTKNNKQELPALPVKGLWGFSTRAGTLSGR